MSLPFSSIRRRLDRLIGRRVLPVLLAALLQLMPMLRAVVSSQIQVFTPSSWAYVFKVAGGVVALLGSYHAVSGATAIVAPYTVNAQVGVPYSRQLTTSGQTAHSWSANTATNGIGGFPPDSRSVVDQFQRKDWRHPDGGDHEQYHHQRVGKQRQQGGFRQRRFYFHDHQWHRTQSLPRRLLTQPQSQTNYAGSTANFMVTASGTAPLSYQWRLNGAPISGATASNYALPNLQTSNAGTYSVVVTNSAGTATSSNASPDCACSHGGRRRFVQRTRKRGARHGLELHDYGYQLWSVCGE